MSVYDDYINGPSSFCLYYLFDDSSDNYEKEVEVEVVKQARGYWAEEPDINWAGWYVLDDPDYQFYRELSGTLTNKEIEYLTKMANEVYWEMVGGNA